VNIFPIVWLISEVNGSSRNRDYSLFSARTNNRHARESQRKRRPWARHLFMFATNHEELRESGRVFPLLVLLKPRFRRMRRPGIGMKNILTPGELLAMALSGLATIQIVLSSFGTIQLTRAAFFHVDSVSASADFYYAEATSPNGAPPHLCIVSHGVCFF